jgi:hypothetical protein
VADAGGAPGAERRDRMGQNAGPRRFWGPNYRKGYTGRDFHVSGGHEAEAEAAERAKKPNRFGMWVLRLLGFRGNDDGDDGERGDGLPGSREHEPG